jgi:hypothetical protein
MSFVLECVDCFDIDRWQKAIRVVGNEEDKYHNATIFLASGHCCGFNTLGQLSGETRENPKPLLDFLSSIDFRNTMNIKGMKEKSGSPCHGFHVKDFFYMNHASYGKLNDPRVKLAYTYPSQSEPGHNIAVYHIKL